MNRPNNCWKPTMTCLVRIVRVSLLSLLALLSVPCFHAQVTFDGCVDFRGYPVASVVSPNLWDIASSSYAWNGTPVIYYNPNIVMTVHNQTKLFFYGHECGHHVLAHGIRNIPLQQEQEADCWSVIELYNRGLFHDQDVAVVQQDLALAGSGDWQHFPGPTRAINLAGCLAAGSLVYRQQHLLVP